MKFACSSLLLASLVAAGAPSHCTANYGNDTNTFFLIENLKNYLGVFIAPHGGIDAAIEVGNGAGVPLFLNDSSLYFVQDFGVGLDHEPIVPAKENEIWMVGNDGDPAMKGFHFCGKYLTLRDKIIYGMSPRHKVAMPFHSIEYLEDLLIASVAFNKTDADGPNIMDLAWTSDPLNIPSERLSTIRFFPLRRYAPK